MPHLLLLPLLLLPLPLPLPNPLPTLCRPGLPGAPTPSPCPSIVPVAPAAVTAVATVNFSIATVVTACLKGLNEPCLLGRYGHYIKIDSHYNGHYNGNHGHYTGTRHIWPGFLDRAHVCKASLFHMHNVMGCVG